MRLLYTIVLAIMAMNHAPVTQEEIINICGDSNSFAQKTTTTPDEINQYKTFIQTATFFHPQSGYNLAFEPTFIDPKTEEATEYSKLTLNSKEILLTDTDILNLMKLLLKSTQSAGNDRKAYVKIVDYDAYVFDAQKTEDGKYSFVAAEFMVQQAPGIQKKVQAAGGIGWGTPEKDLNDFIKSIPFQRMYSSTYGTYDNDKVSLYYANSWRSYDDITFTKADKLALARLVANHGYATPKDVATNTNTHSIVHENRRYAFWFNGSRFCVLPMSV